MKTGWIGLGRMGTPMAMRILKAGYDITVYNRSAGKDQLLKESGAVSVASPAEVTALADIIFIMVPDDNATRAVFTGKDGLLKNSSSGGKIFINMSTISPEASIEMADMCVKQGSHYLDAPVSGSVRQAESGELVVMAGGEEVILEHVRPVMQNLSKLIVHAGKTGSGNTMKLAVNVLLGIISQGLSEAILFGRDHGLDIPTLLNVIQNSALGNVYMKIKGDAIINDNYSAAFALKHITKDLRLARDAGFSTPLSSTALDTFSKAESSYAEEDIIAVIKYLHDSVTA